MAKTIVRHFRNSFRSNVVFFLNKLYYSLAHTTFFACRKEWKVHGSSYVLLFYLSLMQTIHHYNGYKFLLYIKIIHINFIITRHIIDYLRLAVRLYISSSISNEPVCEFIWSDRCLSCQSVYFFEVLNCS